MSESITFTRHPDYLAVSISDKIITVNRAQEILGRIGEECAGLNYKKVLLDEMSVEKREVPPTDIKRLAFDFNNKKQNKVYIAFLCQPDLIDYDSHLLSLYTYKAEFIIQHFTNREKAIDWLGSKQHR